MLCAFLFFYKSLSATGAAISKRILNFGGDGEVTLRGVGLVSGRHAVGAFSKSFPGIQAERLKFGVEQDHVDPVQDKEAEIETVH